jgi:hypothetical protein
MDCAIAINGEQNADCKTRQKISSASDDENPHINVERQNPATPKIIERRRPNRFAIHPANGIVTAVAIRLAVTTQEI